MKKSVLIITLILIFTINAAVSFGASCEGSPEEGLPDYYITFTFNGQTYIWTLGLSDVESNSFGELLSGVWFVAMATPETLADTQDFYDSNNYIAVIIYANPITTGTYSCEGDTRFQFTLEGADYESVSGSIRLDSIGQIGETMEGTFQGSVEPNGGGTAIDLTDGSFRIKRIPDDTWVADL